MNKRLLTQMLALAAAQRTLLADLATDQFIRGTSHPSFKAYQVQSDGFINLLKDTLAAEPAPAPAPAPPAAP